MDCWHFHHNHITAKNALENTWNCTCRISVIRVIIACRVIAFAFLLFDSPLCSVICCKKKWIFSSHDFKHQLVSYSAWANELEHWRWQMSYMALLMATLEIQSKSKMHTHTHTRPTIRTHSFMHRCMRWLMKYIIKRVLYIWHQAWYMQNCTCSMNLWMHEFVWNYPHCLFVWKICTTNSFARMFDGMELLRWNCFLLYGIR